MCSRLDQVRHADLHLPLGMEEEEAYKKAQEEWFEERRAAGEVVDEASQGFTRAAQILAECTMEESEQIKTAMRTELERAR